MGGSELKNRGCGWFRFEALKPWVVQSGRTEAVVIQSGRTDDVGGSELKN